MDDFRKDILKVNQPRTHKARHSIGVYDAFKWVRKNGWFDIGRSVSEHDFYHIVRQMNNHMADLIANGKDVDLPCRMGRLELRKSEVRKTLTKEGKVKVHAPVDWDKTLTLWAEDEESMRNKALVRVDSGPLYKVVYNKSNANYNNQSFFEFRLNRDIKKRLKQKIRFENLDAFNRY